MSADPAAGRATGRADGRALDRATHRAVGPAAGSAAGRAAGSAGGPAAGSAAGPSLARAAAPDSSSVLDIRDLSVVYRTPAGDVRAVDHVNLALAPGEVVGLAGESGSGKSTLAYGACRLLRAPALVTSGRLRPADPTPVLADISRRRRAELQPGAGHPRPVGRVPHPGR